MLMWLLLGVVAYGIYIKFIKPSFYWQNKGVFHVKPWFRFASVFVTSKSFFERLIDSYKQFPDRRYYGSYQFFNPVLIVRDIELIKQITVKDFDHFVDHINLINETADPVLSLNLFSLKGEQWRDMRSMLSPAFTSSKMKLMYTLIQETAEEFTQYFSLKEDEVIELEMKKVFTRFTNDVIANCAFGIKCDSLKDENNKFFTMGSALTTPRGFTVLRVILSAIFPKIFEVFKISAFPSHIMEFFQKIIKDTMLFREKENIIRPDMIHLLMEARKGQLRHENERPSESDTGFATVEESSIGKTVSKTVLTDNMITAQALVFFIAGFDTTSSVLSFLSYELAINPDIQKTLQNEIDETISKCGGRVPYEDLLKMKYLDQVISETLRKYPPGYILTRKCVKDYKMEARRDNETEFVLEKGCGVLIAVGGVHMDPNYFPEPQKFDPDRFSEENKGKIIPGTYMPFGSGPRNCIGSRFALLEAKALTVTLLSRFDIVPIKRTRIPIKLDKTFNLSVKDGLWLAFKGRNKETS